MSVRYTEHSSFDGTIRYTLQNEQCEVGGNLSEGVRFLHYTLSGRSNQLFARSSIGRLSEAPEGHEMVFLRDGVEPIRTDRLTITPHWESGVLTLAERTPDVHGLRRELQLRLHPQQALLAVKHRLHNDGAEALRGALCGVTHFAPGGEALIPQEPFDEEGPSTLGPVRTMALWSYTAMDDTRFAWGRLLLRLRQDVSTREGTRIATTHHGGWAAHHLHSVLILRKSDYSPDQHRYPYGGCNVGLYTNEHRLDVDLYAPLEEIPPGGATEHEELWSLHAHSFSGDDERDLLAMQRLITKMPKSY